MNPWEFGPEQRREAMRSVPTQMHHVIPQSFVNAKDTSNRLEFLTNFYKLDGDKDAFDVVKR